MANAKTVLELISEVNGVNETLSRSGEGMVLSVRRQINKMIEEADGMIDVVDDIPVDLESELSPADLKQTEKYVDSARNSLSLVVKTLKRVEGVLSATLSLGR